MSNDKEPITVDGVLRMLEEQLNAEDDGLTEDTLFKDVVGWDSMGILMVMAELDDRLGMTLSEEQLAQLGGVKDILTAIREKGLLLE